MTDEFLCVQCARHQRTCCQDSEIHVTAGDVRRIAPFSETPDFFEFRAPADPIYDQSLEDPFWHRHVFRADGTRRVLKHRADGDCIFLGTHGCILPAEARPLVCRLYPFDYTEYGLATKLASGCPVQLLKEGQQLLPVLGMTAVEAGPLQAQLYREICEPDPGM